MLNANNKSKRKHLYHKQITAKGYMSQYKKTEGAFYSPSV